MPTYSSEHLMRPEITAVNRMPARAPLQGHDPQKILPLDGVWRFQLIDNPNSAPQDWEVQDTAGNGWNDINVPGVWTLQDTGDHPIYSNVRMPFQDPHEPGEVPEHNPSGLYRTEFNCDAGWAEDDVILHIGGFESMAVVTCNGAFVGMGKDSRLPSEFDLTAHLVKGQNTLAIMVLKWSDATWIEDQDHWRHGGIHRSVFVEARSKTRIDDMIVVADYDVEVNNGTLSVRPQVHGLSEGYKVRAVLKDAAGKAVAEMAAADVAQFPYKGGLMDQLITSYGYPGHEAELTVTIKDVQPWSAEAPYLYGLTTELLDNNGKVAETHESKVGFRRVEVRDRSLLINGKAIIIIGVNRHDHHHENGKTLSLQELREDLVTMKRHNINAVRTAHYPNDHRLLDLADELGLYVVDEANVECHARTRAISNDPRYQNAIIERTQRMVIRDRNHACVIGWSLGNESGHGPAHDGAAAMARRLDPTRFVQYEGAIMERFISFWGDPTEKSQQAPNRSERNTTDIICPMYPPIDFIVDWARWADKTKLDDRPLIMCEYSHAMGNSNGSITEYVDAFYAEPALGGGFIWEWRDHGFAMKDENGRFFWAYGGHFGEEQHDGNFCCDGLVGPDGTPHPGLKEYMWAARPVTAEWLGGGKVRFLNRQNFVSTETMALGWSVQKDGQTVESGTLNTVIAPGASEDIIIPAKTAIDDNCEYHLTLDWTLKADTGWAEAGYNLSWDQLSISQPQQAETPAALPVPNGGADLAGEHVQAGGIIIVLGDDGMIASVSMNGETVIEGDVTACFWRATTDNDGVQTLEERFMPDRRTEWLDLGLDNLEMGQAKAVLEEDGDAKILSFEREWSHGNGAKAVHRSRWEISDQGIDVTEEIILPDEWKDNPRAGIRFAVPTGYEQLEWCGLGPDESYNDRHSAQKMGIWHSMVEDQYHAYCLPQENGSHYGTRSFALRNAKGSGLRVDLPKAMSFAARHYHDADLTKASTMAELERRDSVEVHIDTAMRGVGTGACGPDALEPYRVGPGRHSFSWSLKAE